MRTSVYKSWIDFNNDCTQTQSYILCTRARARTQIVPSFGYRKSPPCIVLVSSHTPHLPSHEGLATYVYCITQILLNWSTEIEEKFRKKRRLSHIQQDSISRGGHNQTYHQQWSVLLPSLLLCWQHEGAPTHCTSHSGKARRWPSLQSLILRRHPPTTQSIGTHACSPCWEEHPSIKNFVSLAIPSLNTLLKFGLRLVSSHIEGRGLVTFEPDNLVLKGAHHDRMERAYYSFR